MHPTTRSSRTLATSLLFVMLVPLLAGCAAAAGSASPPPSNPPADGSGQPPEDPDTSVGIGQPGGGDPGPGQPRIVVPQPGQLDVRPIPAQTLTASVDGRRVVIAIDFVSGVEPCYVLDSIVVQGGPGTFAITLRQGHGPGDNACIEIAEMKRTLVDLGELDPGTYGISDALGGAPAITVTVN